MVTNPKLNRYHINALDARVCFLQRKKTVVEFFDGERRRNDVQGFAADFELDLAMTNEQNHGRSSAPSKILR